MLQDHMLLPIVEIRNLITVMDLLTSYPEVYLILDKSADTIAKMLNNRLIPIHSCPITVLSDNGTEYKNTKILIE